MNFSSIANTDNFSKDHTTEDNPPTVETFLATRKPIKDDIMPQSGPLKGFNLWSLFNSAYNFKIVHQFIESRILQLKIDEYFNNRPFRGREGSFASSYTLQKLLADIDLNMGLGSQKTTEVEFWSERTTYQYQNPIVIV